MKLTTASLFAAAMLFAASAFTQQVFTNTYPQAVKNPRGKISLADGNLYEPKSVPGVHSFPLAISLIYPLQAPTEDWDVLGFRFNILTGKHNNVGFLDLGGIANFTSGDLTGLSIAGLWNEVDCNMNGIQIGGICNYVEGDATGFQLAALINLNNRRAETAGIQIAAANVAGRLNGIQIGAYNQTEDMTGMQIGALNITNYLSGIQIGVCNIIRKSVCPVMIGINVGF